MRTTLKFNDSKSTDLSFNYDTLRIPEKLTEQLFA
jgi:hypothetical protein